MSKFVGLGGRCAQALVGVVLLAALAACGGGSSSDAGDPLLNTGASGGSGSGSGGTTVTDTATLSLSLSSTTVTAAAPATVTATVKNKAGTALPGMVVKFTTDAGLGKLSAPSALTDANGVASVIISPAQSTTTGADTIKATVTYLDKD